MYYVVCYIIEDFIWIVEINTNGLHNEDDDSFDDEGESDMEQQADSSGNDESNVEVGSSSLDEAGSESDYDDNSDDDENDDDRNSDSSVEKGRTLYQYSLHFLKFTEWINFRMCDDIHSFNILHRVAPSELDSWINHCTCQLVY